MRSPAGLTALLAAAAIGVGSPLIVAGCGSGSEQPSADELIETIASSSDPQEREDAATELAALLDPEAVRKLYALAGTDPEAAAGVQLVLDQLGTIYRDPESAKDPERRAAALAALAPIDRPEAAQIAIAALRREAAPAVQEQAARSLAEMKRSIGPALGGLPFGAQTQLSYGLIEIAKRSPEAVAPIWPPLVRDLTELASVDYTSQSQAEQLDSAEAESVLGEIAGVDLSAVRPLLRALEQRDYELIANLSSFYIALGKPGSEPILAETVAQLYPTGDTQYAGLPFEFLGAGNPRLEREVTEALAGQGFTVTGEPGFTGGLRWGQSGAYK